MIQSYRLIWGLMTPPERRRFALLVALTILMSLFEMVSVAGILPFLTVLARPELIDSHWALQGFARVFGLQSRHEVEIGLGLAVFAVMVVGMAVRAGVTYVQIRFSVARGYTLGSRLLHRHLGHPYVWHLSQNSAGLAQSLLSEVDLVVRESILPAVLLISNGTILVLIAALLFVVEPGVAAVATGLLGAVYVLAYMFLRRRLVRIGRQRMAANRERFQVVQEVAGGLKEVKVMGLERTSLARFRRPALAMARHQASALALARLPRYALETVVYGGFIAMVLVMIVLRGDAIAELLPLLGLLGMAATKMFPALQQFYQELSSLRLSTAALQRLHDDLAGTVLPELPAAGVAPLPLRREIAFREVRFAYPQGGQEVLGGLSLTIAAGSRVGVVGGTGAGKTTMIDLLLGLLVPGSGTIEVDGVALEGARIRAWQQTIGYVPQAIFLTDDTVAANIAFGLPRAAVDRARVERAARIANLHDFVTADLPQGYDTMVGERGVRLSGGQRQRIGIARALYHDPAVLVLDEATSALDNLTERAVMEAVGNLGRDKTVVMIAHRLSTVRDCDRILLLERGRLAAEGTYDELVAGNDIFRRMAGG